MAIETMTHVHHVLTDLKDAFEHESPAMSERTRTMIREAYFVIVALTTGSKIEPIADNSEVGALSHDLLLDNFHWSKVSDKHYDVFRAELVRRLQIAALPSISHDMTYEDLCRLSRVFVAHSNYATDPQDKRIHEWLNSAIEKKRYMEKRCAFIDNGYRCILHVGHASDHRLSTSMERHIRTTEGENKHG